MALLEEHTHRGFWWQPARGGCVGANPQNTRFCCSMTPVEGRGCGSRCNDAQLRQAPMRRAGSRHIKGSLRYRKKARRGSYRGSRQRGYPPRFPRGIGPPGPFAKKREAPAHTDSALEKRSRIAEVGGLSTQKGGGSRVMAPRGCLDPSDPENLIERLSRVPGGSDNRPCYGPRPGI